MLKGLSLEELQALMVSVRASGRSHRKLSPVDVSDLMCRARAAGESVNSIAEALGLRGSSMITRFLRLQNLIGPCRDRVSWGGSGTLSFSTASELAKLDSTEQLALIDIIDSHELTKHEVQLLTQRYALSNDSLEKSATSILALRPEVVRRYMMIGDLEDAGWPASDEERKLLAKRVVEKLYGAGLSISLRGRTILVSGNSTDIAKIMRDSEFEKTISTTMSKAVSR